MKATVYNDKMIISGANQGLIQSLQSELTYTDKSKQYQLRRLGKTLWGRQSDNYKKLQTEVHGELFEMNGSDMVISSCFLGHVQLPGITVVDQRNETGKKIVVPWVNKPFPLRPYQQEAIDLMMCHAPGTRVIMFDGSLRKVEDIAVGDLLMGPDSKPKKVLNLHRGVGQLYQVTPKKGESFVVNENHLLSLRRSYSSKKRTKGLFKHNHSTYDDEILTISVKDYLVASPSLKHKYKLYKPTQIEWNNDNDNNNNDLTINPYILGAWLGDGTSSGPEFCSKDIEIINAFHQYADTLGLSIYQKDPISFRLNSADKKVGSNGFLNQLRQLNLINNKHIPDNYKFSSVSSRLQLLAGLIDTDGSYYEGIFEITQKSKTIADSIIFIARSLGFAAYIKKSYKAATNSKNKIKELYYRITISGEIDRIPTLLLRKQAAKRQQIKNPLNLGFDIEELDSGQFYGFEVDGDHLYLLDSFIVSHNCNYRGVINFATGLGKTLVATHMVQQYKKRALIVCPSDSVAKQFYSQFVECFGKNKVGFYGGGKKNISDITVGIAASVTRNIEEFKQAGLGLVIIDETHHTPATTFFDIAEGIAGVGKVFGLTATDYRSDGKDILITAGCGPVLIRRDIGWGVENGFLAEPYFLVREVATGGRDFKDDKLKSYKEHVLNNHQMKSRIEDDARAMMASGKAVLILVDEVAHGEELAKNLCIPFATGLDKKSQDYVDQLNNHKIPGLVGTDGKISEGTDTKNVDVLILANFVASKGPVIQAVGRGLRKQGTKVKCLVLDYIPMGSTMLARHANNRIAFYEEISDKVKVIKL